MIAIAFSLILLQAPAYFCAAEDTACWMEAATAQQERAEHAEGQANLLKEANTITKRLLADSDARGDRWQKLAEKIAPKPPAVWETPAFWLGLGFVAGAASAIAITYAVNQPR